MTLKDELKPLVLSEHEKPIEAKIKPKKEKPKPTKVELELKQVQDCLKNKDERIKSLERNYVDVKENKDAMIRNFNWTNLAIFTIAFFVLLVVSNHFHHSWFIDVAPHFALLGCFCIGINIFIGLSSWIYENIDNENTIDENVALTYFVFNCIAMPIVLVMYWVVQGMINSPKFS